MKPIFVIGPSGAGKTTLSKQLSADDPNITHVSFDEQLKLLLAIPFPMPQGRSGEEGREFWQFCKGVIDRFSMAKASDLILLVDVDAGAEYIPECQAYLMDRADSLVCIMADAAILHKRELHRAAELGNPSEPQETYLAREFSPDLQRLYQSAAATVDVSDADFGTTLANFKAAVESLAKP